jgi:hypothetical protein
MSYTDYAAQADEYRRLSRRSYRHARRQAEWSAREYGQARTYRRRAAWLTQRPSLWAPDSTPADVERCALSCEQLADTLLASSHGDTGRARWYASMARDYDRQAAEATARLAAYAERDAEQAVRDILTAAGHPRLADEGAGPDWRILTPGWHVFTYQGKVRVDWWSDGTLSTDPAAWAADSARLAELRPTLEAAGLAVTAPDGSVLEIAAEITTPCAVCAAEARTKASAFFAGRGLDWPLTEVAGRPVHKACASEIESLIRYAEDGQLRIGPDGIGRWLNNGHAIPDDCAAMFAAFDLAPGLNLAATEAANQAENAAALAAYRAAQPAEASAEEIADMTAAFGPGETVVDVLSGRVTQL